MIHYLRITGEAKEISDYDAATLATFNAAKTHKDARLFGFQPIPTLEQVLGYVQIRTICSPSDRNKN